MFCISGKEMGAPTGNWLYDSARDLTEMASMQFAVYGLMNPYTYQRPKITPLPNETGLTVPGGTGVAVVPNGTAPALKQPYLPGQYTEYPAAVQGWAQQALPGGGSGIESGSETGPYAYLEDEPTVGAGKDFTAAQKQKMLEENMKRNGGVVKSDNPNDYYDVLTKPKKSMKGVTPEPNEWQFDHIKPKDQGGTNSYSNCQIVSRKYNREKWNK